MIPEQHDIEHQGQQAYDEIFNGIGFVVWGIIAFAFICGLAVWG